MHLIYKAIIIVKKQNRQETHLFPADSIVIATLKYTKIKFIDLYIFKLFL